MTKTALSRATFAALLLAVATGGRAERPLPDAAWSFDTGG